MISYLLVALLYCMSLRSMHAEEHACLLKGAVVQNGIAGMERGTDVGLALKHGWDS